MKHSLVGAVGVACALAFSLAALPLQAEIQKGQVLLQAVSGDVQLSEDGQTWRPAVAGRFVSRGTVLKTGANSTADLILQYNGTVLRMVPETKLGLAKLDKEQAGESIITETSLELLSGAIVGSQRKLAAPSRLDVKVPGGVATIVGTEYLVRADGAVTVLSGAVTVTYNLPGNKGSVKVTVPAGYSFDPATGQVVPTSPDYLVDIIADVNTVRENSRSFKAGGATVVVKPTEVMSPSSPLTQPAKRAEADAPSSGAVGKIYQD